MTRLVMAVCVVVGAVGLSAQRDALPTRLPADCYLVWLNAQGRGEAVTFERWKTQTVGAPLKLEQLREYPTPEVKGWYFYTVRRLGRPEPVGLCMGPATWG